MLTKLYYDTSPAVQQCGYVLYNIQSTENPKAIIMKFAHMCVLYGHFTQQIFYLTWSVQISTTHNINGSQWKKSTDHPGFEPGTFGLQVQLS